jgi:hypothetical protein
MKTEQVSGFICCFCISFGVYAGFLYFASTSGKIVAENASKKKIFLNNHLAFGGHLAVPLRQSLFKFK